MGISDAARDCILVFGGSFDPVHNGHVALAQQMVRLFQPRQLRLVPTGQPWQKAGLLASPKQRLEMLALAFEQLDCELLIDQQEIQRGAAGQPSYTVETLRQIRAECGPRTSLIFAMGADQFQNLHSWRNWRELFRLAHLCAAARPGFSLEQLHAEVATLWQAAGKTVDEIRNSAAGGSFICRELAVDVSATALRAALAGGDETRNLLVPPKVLDYLIQHAIYEKNGY